MFFRLAQIIDPELEPSRQPPSEFSLCAIMLLFLRNRAVTGIPGMLSAVDKFYADHNVALLPRGRLFHATARAINAIFGAADAPAPKRALSVSQLRAIHAMLDPLSLPHTCLWAMVVVAFWGLLRVSEYTGGALKWSDLTVSPAGLSIRIAKSKGVHSPVTIMLARRTDSLCPVAAVERMRRLLPTARASAPAFQLNGRAATRREVNAFLQAAIRRVDPASAGQISSHSCRRGGLTAMLLAGAPIPFLQYHGRWQGDTFRKYLDRHFQATQLLPTFLHAASTGVEAPATAALVAQDSPPTAWMAWLRAH